MTTITKIIPLNNNDIIFYIDNESQVSFNTNVTMHVYPQIFITEDIQRISNIRFKPLKLSLFQHIKKLFKNN